MGTLFPNQDILIDDMDPSVTYIGDNWIVDESGILDDIGNRGVSFRHTLHGTRAGGKISVPFNGTNIQAFGPNSEDYLFPNTSEPIFRCFVDGIGAFNNKIEGPQSNNRLICDSFDMNLKAGLHILTIEIQPTPPNVTFWIDWFEYHPSNDAVIDSTAAVYINAASSLFKRDKTWYNGNDYILTRTNGGTLRFNFTGSSITWFGGSIPEFTSIPRSSAQYSVDGGPPTEFFWEQNPNARTHNQEYFTTPRLPLSKHELVVTYTGSNESIPLMLDHLVVNNGPYPQLPTVTSPASTTNRTTGTEFPSQKPKPDRSSVIIAGVIGGVSLFILGVGVLLCFLRYRSRKRQQYLSKVDCEPFALSTRTNIASQHDHDQPKMDVKSRNVEDVIPELPVPVFQELRISVPYPARGASLARSFRRHQDSGVRFADRDLPPHYTIT